MLDEDNVLQILALQIFREKVTMLYLQVTEILKQFANLNICSQNAEAFWAKKEKILLSGWAFLGAVSEVSHLTAPAESARENIIRTA